MTWVQESQFRLLNQRSDWLLLAILALLLVVGQQYMGLVILHL